MVIPSRLIVLLSAFGGSLAASSTGQQIIRMNEADIASNVGADNVRKELQKAEIIPTVIDDFAPSLILNAKWSSGHASLGNTLKPKDLQDAPSISLSHHGSHGNYVIVLTDPDAPSRDNPKWSEFCHWIAVNDRPHSAEVLNRDRSLTNLDEIMPYKPPGPPEGTGKHRYVFVALAPENGTAEKLHPSKPSGRQHWGFKAGDGETRGVRDWAKENGLVPVGANFIYAEHR